NSTPDDPIVAAWRDCMGQALQNYEQSHDLHAMQVATGSCQVRLEERGGEDYAGAEPPIPLAAPQANGRRNIGCGWWPIGSDAEGAALAIFEADRTAAFVEQNPRRQRVEFDAQPMRRHRPLDALARSAPTAAGRRERRKRQALGQLSLQALVVRIVLSDQEAPVPLDQPLEHTAEAGQARSARKVEISGDRAEDRLDQRAIPERLHG